MEPQYTIGQNITIEPITINEINTAIQFQSNIISQMERKEFFTPLTKQEFETPTKGRDNVYFLKHNDKIIGLAVATCDIPETLQKYNLPTTNVMLIDSIMISPDYRGYGLQRQILQYLYNRAKTLKLDGLVAAVHPENAYSTNNFQKENYQMLHIIPLHGGERLIFFKSLS